MSTSTRFTAGANQDNTLRTVTQDYQAPAYAATIAVTTTAEKTLVAPAALTGALAFNIGVGSSSTAPYVGDVVEVLFAASGADRTITWGSGIAAVSATLVVTSAKYGSARFRFNGVKWVEMSRSITA